MKLGLRLMVFWVFSILVGGGYAGMGQLSVFQEVTYTTVALR